MAHRPLKFTAAKKFLIAHPRGSRATSVVHEYITSTAMMNSWYRHLKNRETVLKYTENKVTTVTSVMPSSTSENTSDQLRDTRGLTKDMPLSNGKVEVWLL